MKQPLVIPTLLFTGGILLGDWLSGSPLLLFCGAFLLWVLALGLPRLRRVLLAALLVVGGWLGLVLSTAILSPCDLRVQFHQPVIVTLRGTLDETPYQRVFQRGEEEAVRTLTQVTVSAAAVQNEAFRPASGRVAVSTAGVVSTNFFGGQTVEITGVLQVPEPVRLPGQFDYRTYLARHGIHYQLRSSTPQDWRMATGVTQPVRPPLADRFLNWAKAQLARGLPAQDEPLHLLWAMTLGWKTALTDQVSLPFMRSGTMHVFAISGLHVALIAGILVALLRVARVPRAWCCAVVIPVIWGYTAVTGWQPSAIRSTIMMSVVVLGWSLRRPWSLVNSLAAAALIILAWDPQQLFQASFQLSFFVVLSIALFAGWFERISRGWLAPDPLLPAELRPRWQRWLRVPAWWLAGSLSVSLAAWIGSLPLIAYYFNLLTPCSLLANLLVVPLSSMALAANLATISVGWLAPPVAIWFNHAAWFFMVLMMRVSEVAAAMPGGWVRIASPTALDFVTYYAVVISLLAGWLWRPRVRVWLPPLLLLLVAACVVQRMNAARVTRITVVAAGGGHVVHCAAKGSAADVLVDCGGTSAFQFTIAPWLTALGENHLERLVLTHGDVRQIGAAEMAVRQFAPAEVITSGQPFRSPSYREMLEAPWLPRERHKVVGAGDPVGVWQVLHPRAEDRFARADDATLVLQGELEGWRVLLLSDLGRAGQEALVARTQDLRADIVVTGLPVEGEPLCEGLLERASPSLIVVADSEQPATRRASARLRARLESHGIPVLYTREGAVMLTLGQGRWTASRADGEVVAQGAALPR